MPELPEVETITKRLLAKVVNTSIVGCEINWRKSIALPGVEQFKDQIKNQRIQTLSRRGKFILFHLTHDDLLIHLRMSGDLLIAAEGDPIAKHDQVVFYLDDGQLIKFNDTRKFGRVWLTDEPDKVIGNLGPEPLSNTFTPMVLYTLLKSKNRQIKSLLLDQSVIAGLGNIYTDESLFDAGLSPRTLSSMINEVESKRLYNSIQKTLNKGIANNGASIDWVYKGGGFQNHFRVYQRTGQPCLNCGTPIQKIVVGQRGTHFCPHCQPFQGG